jgi:hypothetical protein
MEPHAPSALAQTDLTPFESTVDESRNDTVATYLVRDFMIAVTEGGVRISRQTGDDPGGERVKLPLMIPFGPGPDRLVLILAVQSTEESDADEPMKADEVAQDETTSNEEGAAEQDGVKAE